MLTHLRQLSFMEGGASVTRSFLVDSVTPAYFDRQPELLCLLFDELNLQRPEQLAALFSPEKPVAPEFRYIW